MKREDLKISYQDFLAEKVKSITNSEVRVIFLYDSSASAYDEIDEYIPLNPEMYSFKDLEEARDYINDHHFNIVDNFTMMWVDLVIDKSLIYELRG